MKKTVFAVLLVLLWTASMASAATLKVGETAAPVSVKSTSGKIFSLDTDPYKGKVVLVTYTVGENKAYEQQLYAAKLDTNLHESAGIINLKDISLPNFVLKKAIAKKEKETGKPIFIDDAYSVLNAWGLSKKALNVIVFDKNKVCRYIYRGTDVNIPAAEVGKLIAVMKEYMAK